jgi:hypothetical protein
MNAAIQRRLSAALSLGRKAITLSLLKKVSVTPVSLSSARPSLGWR